MHPRLIDAPVRPMTIASQRKTLSRSKPLRSKSEVSLSRYFPAGTQYFYGYPAGQDSRFFNRVPPASEEVVAARALVCAGDAVSPIVFSATMQDDVYSFLREDLGVALAPKHRIVTLPSEISVQVTDERERNVLMKKALTNATRTGCLVMAQPYLEASLMTSYQSEPEISVRLNDKVHLREVIPDTYLPARHAVYATGEEFARSTDKLPIPCVVKVSSSSSGDGVRICQTQEQLDAAKKEYRAIQSSILIQQFVDIVRNFSMQFGVPHDPTQPVEIIGVSEQLTTPEGEFIGGIINPHNLVPEIDGVNDLLLNVVLPKVRACGWYGVGGFDILVDRDERFYVTDPNFRMTGMTSYFCDAANGRIPKRMVSFGGTFEGSERAFRDAILPIAKEGTAGQLIHMIALTRHGQTYRFSAAMLFSDDKEAPTIAATLLKRGIQSKALSKLERNGRDYYPDFRTGKKN